MTVFYAAATNIHDSNNGRIAMVFANKSVADEWWAELTTLSQHNIERISQEFYTHDPNVCDLLNFFQDPRFSSISPKFKGRLFLSMQHDALRPVNQAPQFYKPMSVLQKPIGTVTMPSNLHPSPPAGSAAPPSSLHTPFVINPTSDPPVEPQPTVIAAIMMPEGQNPPPIYSKYIVVAYYTPPDSGIEQRIALKFNTDVAVPRFKSKGVMDIPSQRTLKVEFLCMEDFTGFTQFGGAIGRGQIMIVTDKQVKIYGPIEGGPKESQFFVGTGSWTLP
ncbi:hypothetical protein BJ165DRAFT_1529051 [Panaeolus papilionaceus]|nr:hypothetical protein BJ165DRAFT_1529051 [Panaeolus papilionaceus]